MNEISHGQPRDGARRTGHDEAWDLLPWYVNESLEGAERREVEEHLAACGICREEVRYWRSVSALAREEGDLAVSPQEGLERLRRRRVEARRDAPASRPSGGTGSGWRRRLLAPWWDTPRPVRWLAAAQLAGLVVLAGILALQPPGRGTQALAAGSAESRVANFRTLADPSTTAASEAAFVRVVFAEQTREREMRGVLISVGGRIVAGPSPTGVYTVELAPGDDPRRVLETLRSFRHILFAETAPGAADVQVAPRGGGPP